MHRKFCRSPLAVGWAQHAATFQGSTGRYNIRYRNTHRTAGMCRSTLRRELQPSTQQVEQHRRMTSIPHWANSDSACLCRFLRPRSRAEICAPRRASSCTSSVRTDSSSRPRVARASRWSENSSCRGSTSRVWSALPRHSSRSRFPPSPPARNRHAESRPSRPARVTRATRARTSSTAPRRQRERICSESWISIDLLPHHRSTIRSSGPCPTSSDA